MSPPDAPPFDEPWQAQAFAMTVALSERGLFSWSEWTQTLGAELARRPDAAGNEGYFLAWLAALESLIVARGLAGPDDLPALARAWLAAADATPHGTPIVLTDAIRRHAGAPVP